MDVLLLLIRIFLAAIFAVAGVGKLLDLEGSEKAVKEFGVPEDFAKISAIALPVVELTLTVLLLFSATSWFGAIGATILLLVFISAMARQMMLGNAPDCHCFGVIHSEPVSKKSIKRNIFFAVFSTFLILVGRENQGLNLFDFRNEMPIQLIIGLATVGLLGTVVYFLKKITEQQTQIIRRIELLEIISGEDGQRETTREDVSNPHEGLPIGAPAPDFSAQDLSGKIVSFDNLLAKNKPVVLFFVSPSCIPCQSLLPEIENWQTELKDKINFVFITKGNAKENAEKFGGGKFKQILIQKDGEISEQFKAVWTPTAVLINADGNIASAIAAGDTAIRSLIEKVKLLGDESEKYFVTNISSNLGEEVPEFALENVEGLSISSKDLTGRKTLLTYWSLDCGWCDKMLEDLREWDKTRGADEPELLLLSSGNAEKHKELGFRSQIILDDEKDVSKKIGMDGTPSAVLINENGKIVSEVAVGAENIFALIGKRKL